MKLERRNDTLLLTDRYPVMWLFSSWFIGGGLLCIYMSMFSPGLSSTWEHLLAFGVGCGVFLGGFSLLLQCPGSRVQIDIERRSVRLVRFGLDGTSEYRWRLNQLRGFGVERSKDSDGDEMVRLAVRLESAELVPLSLLWLHDPEGVAHLAETLNQQTKLAACR